MSSLALYSVVIAAAACACAGSPVELSLSDAQNKTVCPFYVDQESDVDQARRPVVIKHVRCTASASAGRPCRDGGAPAAGRCCGDRVSCFQLFDEVQVSFDNSGATTPYTVMVGCACAPLAGVSAEELDKLDR